VAILTPQQRRQLAQEALWPHVPQAESLEEYHDAIYAHQAADFLPDASTGRICEACILEGRFAEAVEACWACSVPGCEVVLCGPHYEFLALEAEGAVRQ